jgi:hypothetical protein
MLQFRENDGSPKSDLNIFFLFSEKELGSALKNRVGQETENTGIILYGLSYLLAEKLVLLLE